MNGSTIGFNQDNAKVLVSLFLNDFCDPIYHSIDIFKARIQEYVFGHGHERDSQYGWYGPDAVKFETTRFKPMIEVLIKKCQRELDSLGDYIKKSLNYYATATGAKANWVVDTHTLNFKNFSYINYAKKSDIYGCVRINTGLPSLVKSSKKSIQGELNLIDYGIKTIKNGNAFLGSSVQQNIAAKLTSIKKMFNDEIDAIIKITEEEVNAAVEKRKQASAKLK